jgi:hypothetical protein
VTLICDAGAFVALERDDRVMWRRLKAELLARRPPLTHGGVVAQVWRGGHGRQTVLARALAGVEVAALDDDLGRRAGLLLGRTGSRDAIDAALVALAGDDDRIATSDATDIQRLIDGAGVHVDVLPA